MYGYNYYDPNWQSVYLPNGAYYPSDVYYAPTGYLSHLGQPYYLPPAPQYLAYGNYNGSYPSAYPPMMFAQIQPVTYDGTTFYPADPSQRVQEQPYSSAATPDYSNESTPISDARSIETQSVEQTVFRYFSFIENSHQVHLWADQTPHPEENRCLFDCEVAIVNEGKPTIPLLATLVVPLEQTTEKTTLIHDQFFTHKSFKRLCKKCSPFANPCLEITPREVLEQIGSSKAFLYQRQTRTLRKAIEALSNTSPRIADLHENLRICKQLLIMVHHLHKSALYHGALCPQEIGLELITKRGEQRYTYSERPYFLKAHKIDEPSTKKAPLAYIHPLLSSGEHRQREDIWALCCVIFEILTGNILFPVSSEEERSLLLAKRIDESSTASHLEFVHYLLQSIYPDAPSGLLNSVVKFLEKGLALEENLSIACQDLINFFNEEIEKDLQPHSPDKTQLLKKDSTKEEIQEIMR